MKVIQLNVIEPDKDQWDKFEELLKTEYVITDRDIRVCLVIVRGEAIRHAELPMDVAVRLITAADLVSREPVTYQSPFKDHGHDGEHFDMHGGWAS